jgi:hypothetical protein
MHTNVLLGKPEATRAVGSYRRRWEDNNKIDFKQIGLGLWNGFLRLHIGKRGGPL